MKKKIICSDLNLSKTVLPDVFWQYLKGENDLSFDIMYISLAKKHGVEHRINEEYEYLILENTEILKAINSIYEILTKCHCCSFLVCRYGGNLPWNPPVSTSNLYFQQKAYDFLNSLSKKYSGMILLEMSSEVKDFLEAFITFPTIFRTYNIYMFCTSCPLIIEISHHLDMFFYSMSNEISEKIIHSCQNDPDIASCFRNGIVHLPPNAN